MKAIKYICKTSKFTLIKNKIEVVKEYQYLGIYWGKVVLSSLRRNILQKYM